MSWWLLLPGAAVLTALWVLPGWWLLRLLGAPLDLVTLGAAPAATSAVIGVLAVTLDVAGVPWNVWVLLTSTALLGVASWTLRRTDVAGRARRAPDSRSARAGDGAKVHPRTAALRELDTSDVDLVDSGGTARLWRLDACSPATN